MAAAASIVKAAVAVAGGWALALAMAAPGAAQDISGSWSAIELAGEPVRGPSVSFDDGRLTGSGGCNRISGSAVITGVDVKFGPLISTRMMCDGKMEAEAAFIAALEAAKTIEEIDGVLTLKDTAGVALAKFTR